MAFELSLVTSDVKANPLLSSAAGESVSTEDGTAYILCLDEALLHRICRVLSLMDLMSVQCTCKDLNNFVVHDRHLWKRITIPRSLSEKLTDTRLMVLIKRAQTELEVVEIHGSKRLTGAFLLADGMKENRKLEKLWLLECPKLSGGALVSLVGHLAKACHEAGSDPVLKSMRLSGSTNVEGRHVRLLEKFRLAETLDVAPCPHCPRAGHVMMCGVYSMLNGEGAPADVLGHAIVRDGEIGCENCLVQCSICPEYFCRAHLFRLNCGLQGICCKCCTEHSCSVCDA